MASTVELTLHYTTVDVHCRDTTDECDSGISERLTALSAARMYVTSRITIAPRARA